MLDSDQPWILPSCKPPPSLRLWHGFSLALLEKPARTREQWRFLTLDTCERCQVDTLQIKAHLHRCARAWGLRSYSLPQLSKFLANLTSREAHQAGGPCDSTGGAHSLVMSQCTRLLSPNDQQSCVCINLLEETFSAEEAGQHSLPLTLAFLSECHPQSADCRGSEVTEGSGGQVGPQLEHLPPQLCCTLACLIIFSSGDKQNGNEAKKKRTRHLLKQITNPI